MRRISGVISWIMIKMIKFYRVAISPHLRSNCRYTPTCSEYSIQAIRKYGPVKGGYLSVKRIMRCNPWGSHGYDPLE